MWSIALEGQLYLLFPLLLFVAVRWGLRPVILLGLVVTFMRESTFTGIAVFPPAN